MAGPSPHRESCRGPAVDLHASTPQQQQQRQQETTGVGESNASSVRPTERAPSETTTTTATTALTSSTPPLPALPHRTDPRSRRWERGCAIVSEFHHHTSEKGKVPLPHPALPSNPWAALASGSGGCSSLSSLSSAPSVVSATTVNYDLWNRYWEAFSDLFGDRLEALTAAVAHIDHSPRPEYRRVLLTTSAATAAAVGNGSGTPHDPGRLEDLLLSAAHSFGAVELVHRERRFISVQFTAAAAAALFQLWATRLPISSLIESSESCGSCETKAPGGGGELANTSGMELLARLAPHDPQRLSTRLLLGPHVLLSTPFVESLFKGMFDAVSVEYKPSFGAFVVQFASISAARTALHALQYSLVEVFRIWLLFE